MPSPIRRWGPILVAAPGVEPGSSPYKGHALPLSYAASIAMAGQWGLQPQFQRSERCVLCLWTTGRETNLVETERIELSSAGCRPAVLPLNDVPMVGQAIVFCGLPSAATQRRFAVWAGSKYPAYVCFPSSAPLRSRLCVECVLTNEHAPDTEARP